MNAELNDTLREVRRKVFTDGERLYSLAPNAALERLVRERRESVLSAVEALREDILALPSAVEAVLRDHFMSTRYPARYHLLYAAWLRPGVTLEALRSAWALTQVRVEVLRTRFVWDAAERIPRCWLTQRIVGVQAPVQAASDLTTQLEQLGDQPFDLGHEPPVRIHYITTSDAARPLVVVVAHHCVVDYIGMASLLNNLDENLDAEPGDGFRAEAIEWVARRAGEEAFQQTLACEALRAEYRALGPQLGGAARQAARATHGETWVVHREGTNQLMALLDALRAREGTAPGAMLLAVASLLARSQVPRASVLCGVMVSTRRAPSVDMHVNTVPTCIELHESTSIGELLGVASNAWRTLAERMNCPYAVALRDINERTHQFASPDIVLCWRGNEAALLGAGAPLGERIPVYPQRGPWHHLVLDVVQRGEQLEMHWLYAPDVHRREDVESIADRFVTLLEQACKCARDTCVGELVELLKPGAGSPHERCPGPEDVVTSLGTADDLEVRLCAILRELVNADVQPERSLFDYPNASHNILLLKAQIDAMDRFPISVFFDAPNVRALARVLGGAGAPTRPEMGESPHGRPAGRLLRRRARTTRG